MLISCILDYTKTNQNIVNIYKKTEKTLVVTKGQWLLLRLMATATKHFS